MPVLGNKELERLSRPNKPRIVRESFGVKAAKSRRESEERLMTMSFDDMTKQIQGGSLQVQDIQVSRLEKEKAAIEQNIKPASKKKKEVQRVNEIKQSKLDIIESKLQKLAESNDFSTLSLPWKFKSSTKDAEELAMPELNLKSAFPIASLLSHDALESLFKNFIRLWMDRNYEELENFAEPLLVKTLKREMSLVPKSRSILASNLKSSKVKFDLYEVRNVFMSSINQNRKKADSASNYHVTEDIMNEAPTVFLTKKKPGEDDRCGLILQLNFNVYTDLHLVSPDEKAVSGNDKGKGFPERVHDMKIEMLICTGSYRAMKRRQDSDKVDETSNNVVNHTENGQFKIIDFDGFMRGNPVLNGLSLEGDKH